MCARSSFFKGGRQRQFDENLTLIGGTSYFYAQICLLSLIFKATVSRRDAALEPTGMYPRRVA